MLRRKYGPSRAKKRRFSGNRFTQSSTETENRIQSELRGLASTDDEQTFASPLPKSDQIATPLSR